MNDLFAAENYLYSAHPVAALIRDAEAMYLKNPQIKILLEQSMREAAMRKKALREKKKGLEFEMYDLPNLNLPPSAVTALQSPRQLQEGRPSTPLLLVFVSAILALGVHGGFGRKSAWADFTDSSHFKSFLLWHNWTMPGRSTIHELSRAISEVASQALLSLQGQVATELFNATGNQSETEMVLMDSTSVESASAKPCDEANLGRMLENAERRIEAAEKALGMPPLSSREVSAAQLNEAAAELRGQGRAEQAQAPVKPAKTPRGKAAAKRRQRRLKAKRRRWRRQAAKRLQQLNRRVEAAQDSLGRIQDPDFKHAIALDDAEREICDAQLIHDAVTDIHEHGIGAAKEHDYPHSCSDRDAAFIVKSGRPTVFGYKAQLVTSRRGFIYGLILPPGNNADPKAFVPLLTAAEAALGAVPGVVIADDGYPSAENLAAAKAAGVKTVCFKGAKSKKLLGAEYETERQRQLRPIRSAVESAISGGKRQNDMGEVTCFGRENAARQLIWKAIARNFTVMRNVLDPKLAKPHVYACVAPAA